MKIQRKCTAISLLLWGLLLLATVALAAPAATVTHLSGLLVARTASGASKSLSIGSKVESGDTLETAKRTYARLKFTDGGEVTLKPGTRFRVEGFGYDLAKPKEDSATFNLIKGGLRAVTGQIGKRGNQDSYRMKTPTATIGIRGTIFTADYIEESSQAEERSAPVLVAQAEISVTSDAQPVLLSQAGTQGLAAGLYVHVIDGVVNLTNGGGSLNFSAGQFGYTASFTQPPVIIPTNPGIQFTPPPAFSSGKTSQGVSAGSGSGGAMGKTVDCEVR